MKFTIEQLKAIDETRTILSNAYAELVVIERCGQRERPVQIILHAVQYLAAELRRSF